MMLILFLSVLLMVSSTQWFMVWIFLEINTLSMCYLFSKDLVKNKLKSIFVVVYYSVQVFSSLLILLSVMKSDFLSFMSWDVLLLMGVFMKMGFWPFHSWYLKMIESLEMNFSSLWLMMTWQKLLPFFIILFSSFLMSGALFISFLLMNLLLSLVYLKNSFSVKSTLGFSSMSSNSWVTSLILFSLLVWKLFFFFYSLSMVLIMLFSKHGSIKAKSSLVLMFLVFNMSGLPPMGVFWAKVLSIKAMLFFGVQKEIIILLLLSACYIIFFYLYMILLDFLLETFN